MHLGVIKITPMSHMEIPIDGISVISTLIMRDIPHIIKTLVSYSVT